jgi:hypothetical protein
MSETFSGSERCQIPTQAGSVRSLRRTAVCVPRLRLCDPDVLHLDHIAGGGNQHRRDIGIEGGTAFYQ